MTALFKGIGILLMLLSVGLMLVTVYTSITYGGPILLLLLCAVPLAIGLVIYREAKDSAAEQPNPENAQDGITGLAWLLAALGVLAMVLSGGCALMVMPDVGSQYVTWGGILFLSGIPFVTGLALFLGMRFVIKRRRARKPKDE